MHRPGVVLVSMISAESAGAHPLNSVAICTAAPTVAVLGAGQAAQCGMT
jgi:hypothetical protein